LIVGDHRAVLITVKRRGLSRRRPPNGPTQPLSYLDSVGGRPLSAGSTEPHRHLKSSPAPYPAREWAHAGLSNNRPAL